MNTDIHLVVSFCLTYILSLLLGIGMVQSFYIAVVGALLGTLIDVDHVLAVATYPGGLRELAESLGRGDLNGAYVILCSSDGGNRYPLYHAIHPILLGAVFALWISYIPLPWKHAAIVLPIHFFCDFFTEPMFNYVVAYLGGFFLVMGLSIVRWLL